MHIFSICFYALLIGSFLTGCSVSTDAKHKNCPDINDTIVCYDKKEDISFEFKQSDITRIVMGLGGSSSGMEIVDQNGIRRYLSEKEEGERYACKGVDLFANLKKGREDIERLQREALEKEMKRQEKEQEIAEDIVIPVLMR